MDAKLTFKLNRISGQLYNKSMGSLRASKGLINKYPDGAEIIWDEDFQFATCQTCNGDYDFGDSYCQECFNGGVAYTLEEVSKEEKRREKLRNDMADENSEFKKTIKRLFGSKDLPDPLL